MIPLTLLTFLIFLGGGSCYTFRLLGPFLLLDQIQMRKANAQEGKEFSPHLSDKLVWLQSLAVLREEVSMTRRNSHTFCDCRRGRLNRRGASGALNKIDPSHDDSETSARSGLNVLRGYSYIN
jgi:hypothetical protein